MIPPIIHTAWIGPYPRPDWFDNNIQRIRELHPNFDLVVYDNNDIEKIQTPWSKLLPRVYRWVHIKDLLMMSLLHQYGGITIDGDFYLFKRLGKLSRSGMLVCHPGLGMMLSDDRFSAWSDVYRYIQRHLIPNKHRIVGPRALRYFIHGNVSILQGDTIFPSKYGSGFDTYRKLCDGLMSIPNHVYGITGHKTIKTPRCIDD